MLTIKTVSYYQNSNWNWEAMDKEAADLTSEAVNILVWSSLRQFLLIQPNSVETPLNQQFFIFLLSESTNK